jgi:hypothetical protein
MMTTNKKTSRVVGMEAFQQAFVETEIKMRRILRDRILDKAKAEPSNEIRLGLKIAADLVMTAEVK